MGKKEEEEEEEEEDHHHHHHIHYVNNTSLKNRTTTTPLFPQNQHLLQQCRFSLLLLLLLHIAVPAARAGDADVMSDLRTSLTNLPSNWKPGTDFCKWSGVACSAGQVVSIDLPQKSISGRLPSSLGKLSSLQSLNIQRNSISGPFPSISALASLQTLNLDTNAFSSVPPDFLTGLSALEEVSLDDNPFAPWSIPDDLSQASSLRTFSASNATVSGSLPDFFAHLSSLEDLRLSYNNLSGFLPPSLAGSSIKNLWLNNQHSPQKLQGRIDVVGAMSQLALLWLQSNSFVGPIPDLSNLTSLASFNVRDNQLTGVVPPSLLNSATLRNVSLSNNNLQGPYPAFANKDATVDVNKGNNFCSGKAGELCDPRVMTLLAVAGSFQYPLELADSWEGNDPCADSWTGIVCDSQGKDILVLNFANQKLVGTISPAIANLTSLTKVLVNNNKLTGRIPSSLTGLKSLQLLDVSNNDLFGVVPEFPKSVTLKLGGNPHLGKEPPPGSDPGGDGDGTPGSSDASGSGDSPSGKSNSSAGFVVGIVVAVLVVVGCAACFMYNHRKKHRKELKPLIARQNEPKDAKHNMGALHASNGGGGVVAAQSELFSQGSGDNVQSTIPIEDLRKATDNFSDANIVGQGGFGVVYKGDLNGIPVAIKRSDSETIGRKTGCAEFEAEVHVLQKTRHRHLVSFLGYCRDNNERLLVYEYMPEGTLGQHLYELDSGKYCHLNWKQRLIIALDVARGVEYLHSLAQESFIHRDLKPSNILLGKDLRAKVSDFGLVKHADKDKSLMTRLAGTFGYLAPEYALTGKVSTKVDVYAYGVILMELVSGRKVLDESVGEENSHLVVTFRRHFINKEKFRNFVDPSLNVDEGAYEGVLQVSELACHCTAREPNQRPTMGYAVQVLSPLVDQWVPSSSNNYEEEDETSTTLTRELEKWQSDSDSSMFSTYRAGSSTNQF